MRVVWSDRARTRLCEIDDYIRDCAPNRATAMVSRLIAAADRIGAAPYIGRALTSWADREIRELLERPFRIVYAVEAERIVILTVKHYRQRLVDRPGDWE